VTARPELLRIEEAAEVLGIGRAKAYQMAQRREIPTVRVGRLLRVPADALREWIEQHTVAAVERE
jgi:excisionase family DNA binding protein